MPVFKQYTENSYRWGIWKTSESLEEMLALLPQKGKYEEGIGKFAAGSISISHTKGYVAVLLGDPKKEVGIDIEYYSGRVRKVAHKFMRADEQESLFRGTETWSLLLHWSAKETMFKCMNASDVDFREHLHVMPFIVDEQGVFSAAEYRTAEKRNFQIHYYLFSDFVLTLSL